MALDISCFETLAPSRYVTFTIPNPCRQNPADRLLRVAVLDSPVHLHDGPPRTAAILVPQNRESDWIFSTESGHLQLLLSNTPDFSRLIVVGFQPTDGWDGSWRLSCPVEPQYPTDEALEPLLLALSPKVCFDNGIPEVPIMRYEDDLIASMTVEKCSGDWVGGMLIENVELDSGCQKLAGREFRRRLRFRRMPNLVQTQVRIVPESDVGITDIASARFRIDFRVLVHPYLVPMVASLSLVSSHIENTSRPKALCLGVGGGALVSFLKGQFGFEVLGVEIDREVLRVARQYFGLEEDGEMIRIVCGDAIEVVKSLSGRNIAIKTLQFDVIMIDMDSDDAGNGLIAPPLEIMERNVLLALRSVLRETGILVVNVIPSSMPLYDALLLQFREVFSDLYEIDTGNQENFVLIATVTSTVDYPATCRTWFLAKLESAISGAYIGSIKKI